jgi:putative redox protein
MMDGAPRFGGSRAAAGPKELVLMGLGGCTISDVISILRKMRAPVVNVEVRLTAKVREEHPQVFTDIHVEYLVFGDGVKKEDVGKAIELSNTKYCSVSAMLRASVNITHSYTIRPAAEAGEVPGDAMDTGGDAERED